MRIVVGSATDVGRVRANNEDAFLVDDEHGCYAVADGMGGHLGGEVASATAIETLRAAVAGNAPIDEAIGRANTAVLAKAATDPALTGMGTTLTGLTVADGAVVIGHVGDSRAYLVRDDAMRLLTDDHSLVGEMIREGRLTVEQAAVHPQRSVITRCLGSIPDVAVDVIALPVVAGDRIVLCSDGLTTMIGDDEILALAGVDVEPDEIARRLVAAACAAGGEDNVTVVVVDVEDIDGHPAVVGSNAEATPMPPIAAEPELPPSARPESGAPLPPANRRRSVVRAVALVTAPILVIAIAVGVLGWYARRSYFIGEARGVVVIYQGVPGGVVGWNPTLRERSAPTLRLGALTEDEQIRVIDNTTRGSLATLRSVIDRWRDGAEDRATTTTTAPAVTTTTRPRVTTSTTRAAPVPPSTGSEPAP
ncbi:MAG: Stp1/IreP family PP2C-type Ser/Thr phosphatase [Actinomycetota bacterium]